MTSPADAAVAIVGVGAILPDARDADAFWGNVRGGHYAITDVDPRALGSRALLRPRPARAREDVLEDRRLGPRLGVGPARLEAADPPARRRGDGRRAEVGGRLHADGARRRRLARAPARPRPHRRHARQRAVGRAALPDGAAHHVPRAGARARARRELRRAARRRARRDRARARRPTSTTWLPAITEDTMPGELGNCVAGRVANLFNLHGPNFTVDAACASAMAAMNVAVEGLVARRLRRRRDRRRGPQHGGVDVREVLRDRRALGLRHAAVRRRRRRLRDGRGRRACSCSSASPTPSATATASTRWCAASAARATARARASPRRTRSASGSPSSAPGATAGSRPPPAR